MKNEGKIPVTKNENKDVEVCYEKKQDCFVHGGAFCYCVTGTLFAGISTSYNTSTRQKIGAITNYTSVTKLASGKLFPSSGLARLQICNATGSVVFAYEDYYVNPQNPSYVTCQVSSGVTVSFYVKSVHNGHQVYGSMVYGIET